MGDAAAGKRIERQVAATPAEFARGLHLAFPAGVVGGPLEFRVTDGRAVMEVSLVPGPDRVIALLRLPTLHVTLRFVAGSEPEQDKMLAYLDLATRRGGG
jgi:hypothetical protein